MKIILSNSSMVPIYEQVADQIKNQVLSGVLKTNDPLPSVRSLSAQLKISALTVKKAYDHLESEGYVTTVHGKGTYVSKMDPNMAREALYAKAENEFAQAIRQAKAAGMTNEEIIETVQLLLDE